MWAEGFFPADLILPSACIRRVWCKTVRGGCVGAGGMDFPMDLILPSACIRFVWRKKARGKYVGADGMDFPEDLVLPSACIRFACANRREGNVRVLAGWIFPAELVLLPASGVFGANRREGNALVRARWIFLTDLILPSACIRRVWRKTGERVPRWCWRDGFFRRSYFCSPPSAGVIGVNRRERNALGGRIDFFRWI